MARLIVSALIAICLCGTLALADKQPQHREVSEDNSDSDPIAKRKFYAWAGKRADSDDSEDSEVEKRKFYAWAGKRADGTEVESGHQDSLESGAAEKRKFYSWAGKRSDEETSDDGQPEKRKFYAWAGKRFYKWDEANEAQKRSVPTQQKTE